MLDEDFEKLKSEIVKQSATLKADSMPKRVMKVFMAMEDAINNVSNADKKTMKKPNLLSFNKLKQKFKKYLESEGDNEHTYLSQLAKYRENPVDSADEEAKKEEEAKEAAKAAEAVKETVKEEVKEESDGAEEEEKKPVEKAEAADYGKEEDYYDEEYDQEEGKDEEESDEDEELEADNEINPKLAAKYSFLFKKRDEMTPQERRWKWVKKSALPKDLVELMDKLTKDKKKKKDTTIKKVVTESGAVITEA